MLASVRLSSSLADGGWVTDSNTQPKLGKQAAVSQASSARRFACTHLLTSVLPKLDPSHHLLVDEIGGHVVF